MKDRQLLKIVREFRAGILGRDPSIFQCFKVCAPLAGFLKMYGVDAALKEGIVKLRDEEGRYAGECNHFWLELPDARVIDPTADQFNRRLGLKMPPIYLGAPTAELHASCG